MTIADDIIRGNMPNLEAYLAQGDSLDDIDEYGFTPLIESVIAKQFDIARALLAKGVEVNKPDMTGRSALHWAADNNHLKMVKLLLDHGANPNAYNRGGQSVLVYPLLRDHWEMKQVLYRHGADLDFALDFINTKLIGHRFQLSGDVDILSSEGHFIELFYEGFFLEFSLDIICDSLNRFINHFSARSLRFSFPELREVINAYQAAAKLLTFQHDPLALSRHQATFDHIIEGDLLVLPVAYQGHAITFIRCGDLWAKCDRGENSLLEGSVNIYHIDKPEQLTEDFIRNLLYKKQSKKYVHSHINKILGLIPIAQLPLSSQTSGNCSWANVDAVVPTAYVMQVLSELLQDSNEADITAPLKDAMMVYYQWLEWDKDRALDECIASFDKANVQRRASKVAILGAVIFQACQYGNTLDMLRSEKILKILEKEEYHYVLDSYLEVYVEKTLTHKGNNLLLLLEDCGINSQTGVSPVMKKITEPGNKGSDHK